MQSAQFFTVEEYDSELESIILACINCSADGENEEAEFARVDKLLKTRGHPGSWANRATQQVGRLLAKALRDGVRDHLISSMVRSELSFAFGLNHFSESFSSQCASAAAAATFTVERSTEQDTILALDTLTPIQPAPSQCQALLADRLWQVFFPERCAQLLINWRLSLLLRQFGEASAERLIPKQELPQPPCAGDQDDATIIRSSSTTLTRKPIMPPPPRCKRRHRRSSRQHRRVHGQGRSCSSILSANVLVQLEHSQQSDPQPCDAAAAAAAVALVLNTDGSNSCRQQQLQQTKPVASCSAGLAHVDATNTCGTHEVNQHHHHHHHRHRHHKCHRHHKRERKAKKTQQPLPPPSPEVESPYNRLCQLHSTPGGFKATLKSSETASSSCPVCASRHFLVRHLGRMVAARSTGQLAELERTLTDCLEQQRCWRRSLQWIASNVKEHRLPGSVRPVVNSCGCSADRTF